MNATHTSAAITTFSAALLALGGVALLFDADGLLPRVMPGLPAAATVLGQLVAAGWLAVAWLNWNQRHAVVGGIYGRPTVLANFGLYLISACSLAHPLLHGEGTLAMRALGVLFGVLTLVYGLLLVRGPLGDPALARG